MIVRMDDVWLSSALFPKLTWLERKMPPRSCRQSPDRMYDARSNHNSCTASFQHIQKVSCSNMPVRLRKAEQIWSDLFADPSGWFDHRHDKANARYPDFKHKETQEALWVNAKSTPAWAIAKLACLAPNAIQGPSFSWNILIAKYVRNGEDMKALELFQKMQLEGVTADKYTFIPILKACARSASLEWGKHIHAHIFKSGCESDVFVASCLIDMYVKCQSIEDAWRVFYNMPQHDAVSWSIMIAGSVSFGQGKRAIELFVQMQQAEVVPDCITFVSVLNACALATSLTEARHIHALIICSICKVDNTVNNALIDMYGKCGSMEDACRVFSHMHTRSVVSWTSMIIGYVNCGEGVKALDLYFQMQREGLEPSTITFVGVLNACTSTGALEEGRRIHGHAIRNGSQLEEHVASGLIDMYAKCGSMEDACQIFSGMQTSDIVPWNAIISGYARCGEAGKALQLYSLMQMEHCKPDRITFLGILKACGIIGSLSTGKHVHLQIIQNGLGSDLSVQSCLIEMYIKCGSIVEAYNVFCNIRARDVISWNSMILGYARFGMVKEAMGLFKNMQDEGIKPTVVTFGGILNACASLASLEEGRRVHEKIEQSEYRADLVLSNCLIDMYAKCGSIGDAFLVFDNMPFRSIVSWCVMLNSCAMHGLGKESLLLFSQFCREGWEVNGITSVCILSACSHAGLVDEGCYYFECLCPVYDVPVSTKHYSCVMDMLGRYGYLAEAEDLMRGMCCQSDSALWISLLSACKKHGNLELGERVAMQVLVLDPENVSAHILLSNIYALHGHIDSETRIGQS